MSQLGRAAGLTGFVEVCREAGLDARRLIGATGLPATVLTDPELRVSAELMARALEMAADESGLQDFALRVAQRQRLGDLGAAGVVIREQPNLRRALVVYARYQWLQNDAYAVSIQEFGDQAVLRIHGPDWEGRQAHDLVVATAYRTIREMMGAAWRPREVWFAHPAPWRVDSYRRVFGLAPSFGQPVMGVVLARDELETPFPAADPGLAHQLAAHLENLTAARPVVLREKVRDLIVPLLPDGLCSAARVAQQLGVDRRTLHRRLAAEATTFSDILDATRREMAVTLLTRSDRPLQSVADLLGFSGLSAFAHWFRRQFAQSASAYRASHAGAPAGRASVELAAPPEAGHGGYAAAAASPASRST